FRERAWALGEKRVILRYFTDNPGDAGEPRPPGPRIRGRGRSRSTTRTAPDPSRRFDPNPTPGPSKNPGEVARGACTLPAATPAVNRGEGGGREGKGAPEGPKRCETLRTADPGCPERPGGLSRRAWSPRWRRGWACRSRRGRGGSSPGSRKWCRRWCARPR